MHGERRAGGPFDDAAQQPVAVAVVGVDGSGCPLRRVVEEVPHGDGPGERGLVIGDRIVEPDQAFLDQLHHDDGGHRLGDGGEAVGGVLVGFDRMLDVGEAEPLLTGNLAVSHDGGAQAGDGQHVAQIVEIGGQRRELGGGSGGFVGPGGNRGRCGHQQRGADDRAKRLIGPPRNGIGLAPSIISPVVSIGEGAKLVRELLA